MNPEVVIYHDHRDRGKTVVRPSAISGNGIFATEAIAEGEVIERCPVLLTDHTDVPTSAIYPYCFVWDETRWAVPLGNAPLYNHSTTPNANVVGELEPDALVFVASRDIIDGEEIVIDYFREQKGETP
jgi:SET domain-containing protein